jgi:hypothetical protein
VNAQISLALFIHKHGHKLGYMLKLESLVPFDPFEMKKGGGNAKSPNASS